ncbi:MAG: SPOR domain-containing protein [Clostridiales bacterium]|nr:SPOR domain-containing protein [Clostridiales bacterium]
MQGEKRIYPRERSGGKWLSYLLLFLSAVVVLSGLVWREGGDLSIEVEPSPTPIPTDAYFDETPQQREVTLPGSTWFALQLGAFESEKAASELAQQFMRRGAAGYVWRDGRYRTLAAVYPSREDAQNVRRQLDMDHEVDSYLYQIDLPALHVRLSGMKGQLDILEAAFIHANDLIAGLQGVSLALDRQECGEEEARETLSGLKNQVEAVSLRLKQRFVQPRHATVEGLIDCFDGYAAFFQGLEPGESSVALGARLKYETLACLNELKSVYDALGNT